jgi:dipeptidyl-peptidase-3
MPLVRGLPHDRSFRSTREKKYAHHISEACWAGARIIQGQWTEQAQTLYDLIILIFSENGKLTNLDALKKKSGVSDGEWEDLLQYSSQVRVLFLSFILWV